MQANLAGAALLDVERDRVAASRLVMFRRSGSCPVSGECLENSFASTREQQCEIALWRDDAPGTRACQRTGTTGWNELSVVTADVTENKRAQLAVLESEESYRTLFEHLKGRVTDCVQLGSTQIPVWQTSGHSELFGISERIVLPTSPWKICRRNINPMVVFPRKKLKKCSPLRSSRERIFRVAPSPSRWFGFHCRSAPHCARYSRCAGDSGQHS